MKNIMLLAVISIFVQGCTSIAQPTASRPLVETEFVTAIASVDTSLSDALSNIETGAKLIIEQQPAIMGDSFFAATGLTCRKLTWQQLGHNIYCLNPQGSWFKVNRVISEYNENDMSEGNL